MRTVHAVRTGKWSRAIWLVLAAGPSSDWVKCWLLKNSTYLSTLRERSLAEQALTKNSSGEVGLKDEWGSSTCSSVSPIMMCARVPERPKDEIEHKRRDSEGRKGEIFFGICSWDEGVIISLSGPDGG